MQKKLRKSAVHNSVDKKKRLMQIMHRKNAVVTAAAVCTALWAAFFTLITIIRPDRAFSPNENRNLSARPSLSLSGIADGSFFKGLSDRFSDQFLFRDQWISLRTGEEILSGRRESHGVYIGSDSWLLAAPETPDEDSLSRIAEAVGNFAAAQSGVSTRMLIVPCACSVMPDKLPAYAPVRDQLEDIEALGRRFDGTAVAFLNPSDILRQSAGSAQLYYKTDHHWTSLGARTVFEAAAGAMGIDSPVTSYHAWGLSDSFLGTLGSQSGCYGTRDAIVIYVPETDVQYYLSIPDENITRTSIYFSDRLDEKDQYQVFLGGNHPLVDIRTTADTGRNLLLFKDSYANSFVQYLIPYYDKIIMIDPRYYYGSVSQTVSREGITDILFLYSANTLFTDSSLADCLEAEEVS